MLEASTGGTPTGGRKRCRRSLRWLSARLGVSPNTVRRLLRERKFTLQANRKQLSGKASPQRELQFELIEAQKEAFLAQGWPVISVDTKKRELIGAFKNPGRGWRQAPQPVYMHDFPSLAQGVAIPYGIYPVKPTGLGDLAQNQGYVYVGTSHDTAAFAVEAVYWWWTTHGQRQYADAPAVLILADGGGSNGYRSRLWKFGLQHRLANPIQRAVTVCHYPTGASKWNPIEHRLFGYISINWAAEPLTSYARILAFIRGTRTHQGLRVRARLCRKKYQTGLKVSDEQLLALNLHPFDQLPAWNYTIKPSLVGSS